MTLFVYDLICYGENQVSVSLCNKQICIEERVRGKYSTLPKMLSNNSTCQFPGNAMCL